MKLTISRTALVLACGALALAACGQTRMMNTNTTVRQNMIAGDYREALTALRDSKHRSFKQQDSVVYWMNEGMLLFLLGDHRGAIDTFERAEQRARALYTRSMRKDIQASLSSDGATDYQGEDYEKVLLNVFKALSFLSLGDADSAMVEARRINEKLEYFNATNRDHKNAYAEDAFAHWLMGVLFEIDRSYDDARIAYTRAFEIYETEFSERYGVKTPSYVTEDIMRAALLSGDREMIEQSRARFGDALGRTATQLTDHAEIIVVHLNGEAPTKRDEYVTCWPDLTIGPNRDDQTFCDKAPGGDYLVEVEGDKPDNTRAVRVAFPALERTRPANDSIAMRVAGIEATSEVALPIAAIAEITLRDKLLWIYRRTLKRALTKAAASHAVNTANDRTTRGHGGAVKAVGWILAASADTTMELNEQADKRAWSTLPARIEIARALVPPGTHDVTLTLSGGGTFEVRGVTVEAGQRVFITRRTLL